MKQLRPEGMRGDESDDERMADRNTNKPSLRLSPRDSSSHHSSFVGVTSAKLAASHMASASDTVGNEHTDACAQRDESGADAARDSCGSSSKPRGSRSNRKGTWSDSDGHASGEGSEKEEEKIVGRRYSTSEEEEEDDHASLLVGFTDQGKLPLMRQNSSGLFYEKGKAHQVASKIRHCSMGLRPSLMGAVNLLGKSDDGLQRYADLLEQQRKLEALDATDMDDATLSLLRTIKSEIAKIEGRTEVATPPESAANKPEVPPPEPEVAVHKSPEDAAELPRRPEVRRVTETCLPIFVGGHFASGPYVIIRADSAVAARHSALPGGFLVRG